ncbi:MAG TPA: hypothetical protein VEL76_33050, partial [Gemmataceae bacterium]|nr:hypothetical protein [Gemmataceae bacterium]
MSKRKGKRQADGSATTGQTAAATPQPTAIPWTLIGGSIAFGLALWFYLTRGQVSDTTPESPPAKQRPVIQQAEVKKAPDSTPSAKPSGGEAIPKDDDGSFLGAFNKPGLEGAGDSAMLANADLEKAFQGLSEIKDRFGALAERARAWNEKEHAKELQAAIEERDRLQAEFDKKAAALDKELKQAREARPADPVPAWLTAELLMLINGEPEVSLRYLRRAVEGGMKRPRVFANLARMSTASNLPDEAFRHAVTALDLDARDRYAWNAYLQAATTLERFAEAAARLDQAFGDHKPAWAEALWKDTVAWRAR